jgi:hypothetical protein
MEEGVIDALVFTAPAIRQLQLIARVAAALVVFKSFLRNAVEGEGRHGAVQARRGEVPLAVGTAPSGETFILDPDHASCHA